MLREAARLTPRRCYPTLTAMPDSAPTMFGGHLTERWENAPAPELLIAQALVKTEKSILATGVTLLALYNLVEVAHRVAMLDHLARGHFYWGIGGGGHSDGFNAFWLGRE